MESNEADAFEQAQEVVPGGGMARPSDDRSLVSSTNRVPCGPRISTKPPSAM